MTESSDEVLNYQLLAEWVKRRRRDLDLSQADVAERGGPSPATLRQIERGDPLDYRRGTTSGLEDALEWAQGTVHEILRGGDPREMRTGFVVPAAEDAAMLASLPAAALEGLDETERAEVLAAARLSALAKLNEIKRRRES